MSQPTRTPPANAPKRPPNPNPPLGVLDVLTYCVLLILSLLMVIKAVIHIFAPTPVLTDLPFIASDEDISAFFIGLLASSFATLPIFLFLGGISCSIPIWGKKNTEYPKHQPILRSLHSASSAKRFETIMNRVSSLFVIATGLIAFCIALNASTSVRYLHPDGSLSCYQNDELEYIAAPDEVYAVTVRSYLTPSAKYSPSCNSFSLTLHYRNHSNFIIQPKEPYEFRTHKNLLADMRNATRATMQTMIEVRHLFPQQIVTIDKDISLDRVIAEFRLKGADTALLYELFEHP